MKTLLLKVVFAFFVFSIGTTNSNAQISIYESPCKGSIKLESESAMIDIAKFGEEENPKIIIEPNSTRERLDIKLADTESWDLLIFNCDGQLVRLGLIKPGKNKISLADLSLGIYYVYMSKGDERWVKKIKKE
jgi:hypothetical protein